MSDRVSIGEAVKTIRLRLHQEMGLKPGRELASLSYEFERLVDELDQLGITRDWPLPPPRDAGKATA